MKFIVYHVNCSIKLLQGVLGSKLLHSCLFKSAFTYFTYDKKIKSQTLFTISLTKRSFSDGSLIEISSVEFELLDSSSDATQLNCSKIFCRKLLQAQIARRTKVQTIEAIVEM